MTNVTFGFPAYSDASVSYTPTVSGGSFTSALPASNVFDRRLSRVARTTDALAASTTMDIDLQVARSVGVLAVLIPNLTKTSTPTIQWKGSSSNTFGSGYDSTALQAWPSALPTAEDVTGMNVWLSLFPGTQTYRYWRLSVVDTANADGYLNFARVLICGAFTPSIQMSVGGSAGIETDTQRVTTDGGAFLYNEKPRRRSDSFTIENLPTSETFANVRAMQQRMGISKQFFFAWDPADTTLGWRRNYCACLRQLDALSYPNVLQTNTVPFQVLEEL